VSTQRLHAHVAQWRAGCAQGRSALKDAIDVTTAQRIDIDQVAKVL
jgi:hypothetical protein